MFLSVGDDFSFHLEEMFAMKCTPLALKILKRNTKQKHKNLNLFSCSRHIYLNLVTINNIAHWSLKYTSLDWFMCLRATTKHLVSNSFEFLDELDSEDDPDSLDEADDDGDGADEEEMVPGQPGQLVGAASVEHIAGVVPHTALGGHSLTTRVGDLGRWPSPMTRYEHSMSPTLLPSLASDPHQADARQSSNPSAPQHLNVSWRSSSARVESSWPGSPYSSEIEIFSLSTNSL